MLLLVLRRTSPGMDVIAGRLNPPFSVAEVEIPSTEKVIPCKPKCSLLPPPKIEECSHSIRYEIYFLFIKKLSTFFFMSSTNKFTYSNFKRNMYFSLTQIPRPLTETSIYVELYIYIYTFICRANYQRLFLLSLQGTNCSLLSKRTKCN